MDLKVHVYWHMVIDWKVVAQRWVGDRLVRSARRSGGVAVATSSIQTRRHGREWKPRAVHAEDDETLNYKIEGESRE